MNKSKPIQPENIIPNNLREAVSRALKEAIKVSWMIIQVYIPLSLVTILLKRVGFIDFIAPFFAPVMRLMGLPGETAITLIAGFTNNVYAALGTMAAFDLTFRQITILGIVIGVSHNLIVETGVLMRLKMANIKIALFRMVMSIITGIIINLIMPKNVGGIILNPYYKVTEFSWLKSFQSIAVTSVQVIVIISIIMLAYETLMLWKYLPLLKKKLRFIPKIVGISERAFAPWFLGYLIGIAYGAGILFRYMKDQKLSHKEVCLITTFLCIAHAAVEDTMLFALVGGNLWWIILTKTAIAIIVTRVLSIGNLYKKFLWMGLLKEY